MKESTFNKYCLVVDEWFVNGFNQRKAYQSFYPKASDETADVEMSRILNIPKIEAYVKEKQESTAERLKTSHEALLQELENWAYSDITETLLLTPEQVKELPVEIRRLITKFKTTSKTYMVGDNPTTETVVELHFVSKERAMEMIHKHVGFYEADNTQRNQSMTSDEREKRIAELKEKMRDK